MHNLLLCQNYPNGVKKYSKLLQGLTAGGKGAYIPARSSTVLGHEI